MEPIVLSAVPQERFNKICYICEEQKRDTKATAGACMQCNRNGCKQYFHVTCAQAQGLLCEVTGSYENVKYCGYCSHHYKKLKNHSNVKTIPAFKPIQNDNSTPESSPEKNPPSITNEDSKSGNVPVIKEVKSPPVDQSVSSTSDALPPTLIPNCDVDIGGSNPGQVSRSYSEVSDISSALSPLETEEAKNSGSDHNQEPSSSMTAPDAPVLHTASDVASNPVPTAPTPEIDVGDSAMEFSKVEVQQNQSQSSQLPAEGRSTSTGPRKKSTEPSKKGNASKKNVRNAISSTVTNRFSAGKESKKSSGKRRRDSAISNSKVENTGTAAQSTNLPGHHDYCGSIFGGSPYFQSLSAPGHVSLSSFSAQDNSSLSNGAPVLLHPPKHFPSHLTGSPRQNQDHSQEFPLTMEHLLEQQWEQGAQFLMEQGQHFDIASLLSCLHRLKGENHDLEEQVRGLTSRRDHLIAVNARLSLPLSLYDGSTSTSKSSSVGSLEDISSPDDVQAPSLEPTVVPSVQIPQNTSLIVEDILSPAENESPSLSSDRLKFCGDGLGTASNYTFSEQVCRSQPLLYSVVNPPPPTLSAVPSSMKASVPPYLSSLSESSSCSLPSSHLGTHLSNNSDSSYHANPTVNSATFKDVFQDIRKGGT
ncbi:zinc finger protein zfp-1 isoform X2 [Aplysia californica]|nr:zinc finger protein zfp-1 isoform X2 [Aplysia californica]